MKWNNGRERKLFKKQQDILRKQYIAAGMSEDQIQAIYDYDLSVLNGRQREARHTQRLDIGEFDDDKYDEGENPLLDKFADKLTVEMDCSEVNRYSWTDEIDNETVARIITKLPMQDIELLTKIFVDGFSLTEIACMDNITQQAVSKKLQKIKSIFQNRL